VGDRDADQIILAPAEIGFIRKEWLTMMRTRRRFRLPPLLLIFAVGLGAGTAVRAAPLLPVGPVTDPSGDLRTFDPTSASSYAGPPNPALDVVSVNVILNPALNTLTFTQTMAGPISGLIDPSTGALLGSYSWGINHGYSSSNFAELNLPNVLFDAVLTLNPNGTGSYRGAQAPAGSVTVHGDTLTAVLPVSFLAPPPQPANAQGPLLDVTQWSYDLWPRSSITTTGATLGFGDAQIADFAPNANDFTAQAVPEPSSVLVLAAGIFGVGLLAWRSRRSARLAWSPAPQPR
jgi:hypothetical protein